MAVPPLFTTLGAILRLAGGSRPLGLNIGVEGAPDYDASTETFMPEHTALLRVFVEDDQGRGLGKSLTDLLPGFDAGRPSKFPASSRDGVPLELHGPSHEYDVGASVGASLRRADATRMEFQWVHETMPPDVEVTQVADVGLGVHLPQDAYDPVEETEDETEGDLGIAADTPTEWRIRVHVHVFQSVTRVSTLFVARDEPVSSFIRRAEIILKPHTQPWDLYVPNPQPHEGRISVLLSPSWWESTGVHAVLVASEPDAGLEFATVALGIHRFQKSFAGLHSLLPTM